MVTKRKLIYFTSPTCSPCKAMKPLLNELDIEMDEHDVSISQDLAYKYAVRSVPAFFILEGENVLNQWVGTMSKKELETFVYGEY